MASTTPKAKPTYRIKSGPVEVAIWANEGKNGTFYTVTPSRSYRVGQTWKHSSSFPEDMIPLVQQLLGEATTWIRTTIEANPAIAAASPEEATDTSA